MPKVTPVSELQQQLLSAHPPRVLDVRREANFLEAPQVIPGSQRFQPESVNEWAGGLPKGSSLVVYCVHGRQVSQGVAAALEGLGLDASYLEGGIEAWKKEGGTVTTLEG